MTMPMAWIVLLWLGTAEALHAVIVQNKGGGHGEIGYHLAKQLKAKGMAQYRN